MAANSNLNLTKEEYIEALLKRNNLLKVPDIALAEIREKSQWQNINRNLGYQKVSNEDAINDLYNSTEEYLPLGTLIYVCFWKDDYTVGYRLRYAMRGEKVLVHYEIDPKTGQVKHRFIIASLWCGNPVWDKSHMPAPEKRSLVIVGEPKVREQDKLVDPPVELPSFTAFTASTAPAPQQFFLNLPPVKKNKWVKNTLIGVGIGVLVTTAVLVIKNQIDHENNYTAPPPVAKTTPPTPTTDPIPKGDDGNNGGVNGENGNNGN